MAIIDSVRKLAEKVGADTNGRTIADQINLINQHLEATNGRDISEAVNYYADKAGGSTPTPETFEVEFEFDSVTGEIESDKTFTEAQEAISENKRLVLILHLSDDEGGTIDFTFDSYTYSEHLITFTLEHFTDEITITLLYWCDSEYHIERGSSNISMQNIHVRPNA